MDFTLVVYRPLSMPVARLDTSSLRASADRNSCRRTDLSEEATSIMFRRKRRMRTHMWQTRVETHIRSKTSIQQINLWGFVYLHKKF